MILALIGFLVSIPVFFDVAFILLAPILFALAARTGQPVVRFALPLLAGLAATHAFIPPTPGPIAVAELLEAPLGWVIVWGILAGLPAVYVGGPLWSRWVTQPGLVESEPPPQAEPVAEEQVPDSQTSVSRLQGPERSISFLAALATILLPLILILSATFADLLAPPGGFRRWIEFFGHPFIALLLACIIAYSTLRFRLGISRDALVAPLGRALEPAGVIILVTGAGGVFKQMLVETGVGARLADGLTAAGLSPVIYAFVIAAVVRVAQGSATVAMITAAGLTAPVVEAAGLSPAHTALLVIAIASGATVLSHVNDSGFWLVSRYLNLSVGETLRTWTVTSTLVGLVGFIVTLVISLFLS
jgi:Gnt-I system low-affinity gluconate transporter